LFTTPPRGSPSPMRGHRGGRSAGTRLRQRAATARHMVLMHDAALRYDDTREGQLGDILHFPDVIDINVFGSKTDPLLRGQSATLPGAVAEALSGQGEGPSGRQSLLDSTRCSLQRLLQLPRTTLTSIGLRLSKAHPTSTAGPEALSTWPAELLVLARPLYELGVPVHLLPYYGPWMWEPIDEGFDLSRSVPTGQFQRSARDALAAAGRNIQRFGAHSMRRGRAAELAHSSIADATLSRVLRHTSVASSAPYVFQSVHSANTAAALQAAARRSRGLPAQIRGRMARPPGPASGSAGPV
jgi:hypothetical protein